MALLDLEKTTTREYFNCVGYTKRGYRCSRKISKVDAQSGQLLLDGLPSRSLDPRTLDEDLEAIANKLLCSNNHRKRERANGNNNDDQVHEMVTKWRSIIVRENERSRARFCRQQAGNTGRRAELQDNGVEGTLSLADEEAAARLMEAARNLARALEEWRTRGPPSASTENARRQPTSSETSSLPATAVPTAPEVPMVQQSTSPRVVAVPETTTPPANLSNLATERRAQQLHDNQCPVCLDEFQDPCETPCGHIFCHSCATLWVASSHRGDCPTCRHPTRLDELVLLRG